MELIADALKDSLHPLLFRRHFDDNKVGKMTRILMDGVPHWR
jgi:SWI/SNF-related matrix-associated actin-dependent regulator 1 of chromatin subfamily A